MVISLANKNENTKKENTEPTEGVSSILGLLSTETENTLWQVFSVYHIKTENYYITTDFKNDEEFQKFINTISSRSKLKFDATVDVNDTILTLSTCYKTDEKVVLHAKIIKKEVRN